MNGERESCGCFKEPPNFGVAWVLYFSVGCKDNESKYLLVVFELKPAKAPVVVNVGKQNKKLAFALGGHALVLVKMQAISNYK